MADQETDATTQADARSTRRRVLAGAVAGATALVAGNVVRPAATAASSQFYTDAVVTPVLSAQYQGTSSGVGVEGSVSLGAASGAAGVHATSGAGVGTYGLYADGPTAIKALGTGGAGIGLDATGGTGVKATSSSSSGAGVEAVNIQAGGALALYAHLSDAVGIAAIGRNFASSGAAVAVKGISDSPAGIAVAGVVPGGSSENYGVYGETASSKGRGVFGRAIGSTGGQGVVGQGDAPTATGVLGVGWDGTTGGSYGTGVIGIAGIHDKASWPAARSNTGVFGHSPSGTGVRASSTSGTALDVAGKAKFSRSGTASVGAGKTSVDVTVPGGIGSRTVVHATMQTYRSGVAIAAVRRNYPSTGQARIYLTKVGSSTSSTTVAWLATEY